MSPDEGKRPVTFVLSGPGGVGKGTIVAEVLKRLDDLWLSRSWTTRERRPGEAPDAYNFTDRETFLGHVEADGFVEWVEFLDYLQGTPVPNPPPGMDVLLEIDVQGAAQIQAIDPEAVLIFLDAPTRDEQLRRLRSRGDAEERVQQRLVHGDAERTLAAELGCLIVINDELEAATARLIELIDDHR